MGARRSVVRLRPSGSPHGTGGAGDEPGTVLGRSVSVRWPGTSAARGSRKSDGRGPARCGTAHLLAVPAVRPKPAWGGIGVAIRGRPIETAFCDPRPSSLPTANKQGWRGHLWQGRFASFVMDEPYLLVTARYVELNPVRAGLVEAPSEYAWSGARAHLAGRDDGLVQVAPLLELAPNWRRLLTSAVTEEELKVLRGHERTGRPLGDDDLYRPAMPACRPAPRPARRRPQPTRNPRALPRAGATMCGSFPAGQSIRKSRCFAVQSRQQPTTFCPAWREGRRATTRPAARDFCTAHVRSPHIS